MYENIQFSQPHFDLSDDGYFFMFDNSTNRLIKKLHDGTIVFSYPVASILGATIKELVYDGFYFWTLQDGLRQGYDLVIKKWIIIKEICYLNSTINLIGDSKNRYSSDTFTIESYNSTLLQPANKGFNLLYLQEKDFVNIIPGIYLTIGPNALGQYDEIQVVDIQEEGKVVLDFPLKYSYTSGTKVYFNTYIYLFNNYNGIDESKGAIYRFLSINMYLSKIFSSLDYKNIKACSLEYCTNVSTLGSFYSLIYNRNNSIIYLDYKDMSTICSMVIDNIKVDNSTLIPIYSLKLHDNNIYRLQNTAMFFGNNYTWSSYNYVLSPVRAFVDSVVLEAYPNILPNNATNVSDIKVIVKDQFDNPLNNALVNVTDDDSVGFILSNNIYTWVDGVAVTAYKSGIDPRTVKIETKVTQIT